MAGVERSAAEADAVGAAALAAGATATPSPPLRANCQKAMPATTRTTTSIATRPIFEPEPADAPMAAAAPAGTSEGANCGAGMTARPAGTEGASVWPCRLRTGAAVGSGYGTPASGFESGPVVGLD